MRNRSWPITAKYTGELPVIEAHSRGGQGSFGHYSFGIGGGARVVWTLNIVPMNTSDAVKFRAFLHSLRGSGGSFDITMPTISGGALQTGTVAAAASGATSLVVTGFTPVAGAWMTVTTAGGSQLVRVTGVSGPTATIRPALRSAAAASAAVAQGPVTGTFRLIGNAPAIPLIVTRSKGFTLECEEAY